MNKEEYDRLQSILTRKLEEHGRDCTNRSKGYEEAILCVKSVLSKQFKPKATEIYKRQTEV